MNCASSEETTNLLISKADSCDRQAMLNLVNLCYQEYEKALPPDFLEFYNQGKRKTLLEEESIERIVAKKNGVLVGSVILIHPYERTINGTIVKNDYPEMRLLAVNPNERNTGIASYLIEACEQETQKLGFNSITLHTTDLMKTAKAMYLRRNYIRYSQIDFEAFENHLVQGFIKHLS